MNKKKKTLVIGWDAADWKVINPLLDKGLMPHLEKMINSGTIGNLATLDPPLSPMLWTSIATGVRPYKHGITGFTELAEDGKTIKPVTLKNRRVKAIWNILSEHQYKTHVFGWWPSHPAEAINGIMVSNFFQRAYRPISEPWVMKKGTVYPEEKASLFATMRIHPGELTANHIAPFVPLFKKIDQKKEPSLEAVAKIISDISSVHAAATYALEFEEWDFAAVYYDGIDHFNHSFIRFHPPRQDYIPEEKFEIYKDVVSAGYRFHDMMLGRLLQLAGEDATVFLISDHGFHPDHHRKKNVHRSMAGPADEHSPYGIICARGPGIKKDEIIYGASILDITPTLLTLCGLPVGEDMDGKTLVTLFDDPPIVKKIPSWSPGVSAAVKEDALTETDIDTLKQLADLGYIEDPAADRENAGKNVVTENNYFLARAYMDGKKFREALVMFQKLFEEKPWEIRFATSLCSCCQQLMMTDKVGAVIAAYHEAVLKKKDEEKVKQDPDKEKTKKAAKFRFQTTDTQFSVDLMQASLFVSQQKPEEALQLYRKILQRGISHAKIHLYMGNCYAMKKEWKNAIAEYNLEVEYNYDDPEAHHGLGFACLKMGKYEEAAEHLLDAIGLKFDFPFAHYHLAECFYRMKDWERALNAYEVCLRMEPGINKARKRIARIYEEKLHQPEEAKKYRDEMDIHTSGLIYVVSGLPRSGTSMMMRMLQEGGMEIFSDRKRGADTSNPHGYFEHEAVLRMARDNKWIGEASGKVIKVVTPLIPFLPPRFRYKIIFMERELSEIMVSQQTMLVNSGKAKTMNYSMKIGESYKDMQQKALAWCEKNKNIVEFIRLRYERVVENPDDAIKSIRNFIDTPLLAGKMKDAVDKTLYRNRTVNPARAE